MRLRRRLFTALTFSLGLPVADRRGGRLSNAAKGCAGSPWGSRGWGLPGRGPWRRRVLEWYRQDEKGPRGNVKRDP